MSRELTQPDPHPTRTGKLETDHDITADAMRIAHAEAAQDIAAPDRFDEPQEPSDPAWR